MTSLYQSHPVSHYEPDAAPSDGWILYYSPEGFPYYYNEVTGESQWAEHEEEMPEVEGSMDPSDEPSSSLSSSSSEEDEEEASASLEGDGFDEEFQAYLASPEGQKELEEERLALEKYTAREEPARKPSSGKKAASNWNAESEMDDMVVNAFGVSAFKREDDKYNPYQQQPYQEQFMQQQRQQQYEYERYEYENHQKQYDQELWEEQQRNAEFARSYGLPEPPISSTRRARHSSVTFDDDAQRRYYEDDDMYSTDERKRRQKRERSYGRRRKDSADDLEGGEFREFSVQRDDNNEDGTDSGESEDDLSLSSDDSDVKILREPLIPGWLSWRSLTRMVDRTIGDPIANASSKIYHALVPESASEARERAKKEEYDEEGGSGSGSDNDDSRRTNDLHLQPLRLATTGHGDKGPNGTTTSTSAALHSSASHYLSLLTPSALFSPEQREWIFSTYASTTAAVWNYVTNTTEFMVDGQPVRRGIHEKERPEPLPP